MAYPILDPLRPDPARRSLCALAVMAKAPRPGKVKTRLCPPLTYEQSAALNICFLRDTTENIEQVSQRSGRAAGVISYTPSGEEALFDGLLPHSFSLVLQRSGDFGERLLGAAEDILSCGFGAVCLIDSDSPTVPAAAFEQAAAALLAPGDRVVLGGSHDGGYYLIGVKHPHATLFQNIHWSTASVFDETVAAANAAGLPVEYLPLWYDVDDGPTLGLLRAELLDKTAPPFTAQPGYAAPHTRRALLADLRPGPLHDYKRSHKPDSDGYGSDETRDQGGSHTVGRSRDAIYETASSTPAWRRSLASPWLTNALLVLLGLGLLLLARQLISEFNHYTLGFSGVSGRSLILYVAAVTVILTRPVNRYTFGIILTATVLFYAVVVLPDPYLSSDVYRYAWDGVVQHAHISPYRYVPGDPALTFLRAPNQDLFDNINRRDYAHTIYPPGAQMLFLGITFLNPSVTGMKCAMIAFAGLTLYGLLLLFREMGIRRERILLYAWCPLLVWEIGSSGHLDSVAMAFFVFAMLARLRGQQALTGIFLAFAVLTKLYPVVLFPAFFQRRRYRMPVVLLAVILCSYACYLSVGLRVFGFLRGYVQEEGMHSGERYFLLEQAHHMPGLGGLPTWAYLAFCGAIAAVILAWCWRACRSARPASVTNIQRVFGLPAQAAFIAPAAVLSFIMMLLFSPHYPWYVAWLVPFLALVPSLSLLAYTGGVFFMFTTALAVGSGPKEFVMNQILYSAVLLAFCVELAFRRWPLHRRLLGTVAGTAAQEQA